MNYLWFISWSDVRQDYPSFWRHPLRWLRVDWHNTVLKHWRDSWGKPWFIR
jgi:hypothetical protein